jgi:transcriptional regulator with XRE-family HTH domain
MSISPEQAKAARVALGWSQDKLAGASGVSTSSIKAFEYGRKLPFAGIREAIEVALEAAGVEFTNDGEPGARLRKAK